MTKPRILVTTGAGRTGSVAATELAGRGYPVRCLVHRDDERAARLRRHGIEVVVGDLTDWRDLSEALRDVQRAYHCPPFDAQHLHNSMLFALAAEQAGVEVVALMSGWNAHAVHPSVLQREHWLTNNLYRRQPFDVIHINPGMLGFTYLFGLPVAAHLGLLALPFGDGLNAPPSNEDIGRVAASVLENPAPFIGRCLRPTGPVLVSPSEVAEALGQVLDRKLRYRAVSDSMFVKAARAQRVPTFQIAQIRHYAAELRAGAHADVTDHVEEVCGRPPEDMHTIVERYVREPDRILPGLRIGSRLGAMRFVFRMARARSINLDRWEQTRDYPTITNGVLAPDDPTWLAASTQGQLALLPDPSKVA